MIEHKAFGGKLWVTLGLEQFDFTIQKNLGQTSLGRCGERKEGREGIWKQESSYKDLSSTGGSCVSEVLMSLAYYAVMPGDWRSHLEAFGTDDKFCV